MGNAKSISSNNSKLATEIDRIASNYILSQTFDDINKLSEKDHCDKLVLLTAKIINKNLNPLEQKELVKRIDGGIPAAAQATAPSLDTPPIKNNAAVDTKPIKDNAAVDAKPIKNDAAVDTKPIKEDAADEKDKVGGTSEDKDTSASEADTSEADTSEADRKEADRKADCIKIAKFYVKIAHLYAAIMKTINPVIISKDENGKTKKYDLMNKQNMPDDAEIKSIQHNNFCTTRLNALMQEGDINKSNIKNQMLTISPRFCSINYDLKSKKTRKFYEGEKNSSDIKPSYGGDKKNKDSEDDDDEDDEDTNKKDKKDKDKDKDKEKEKDKNGKKKSKDSDDEDDEDDEDEKRKRKTKKIDKDENDEDEDDKSKNRDKKEKDVVVNEPINVKETPMPMDSTEVGIPELMKLYYDVYDDKKGAFTSMSPEAKISYQADVDAFYMAFTGKEIETDENGDKKITKFEQIPLREFHKTDGCKPDGIYTTSYEGSLRKEFGKENLFEKYANHVNKMMNSMNANQNNLFGILKKLFKFQKHKEPEKKEEKVEEKEKKVEEKKEKEKKEKVEEKEKDKDTAIAKDTGTAAPMPVVFQGPGQGQAQGQEQAQVAPDPTKAAPEPAEMPDPTKAMPIGPAVVAEPAIKPAATVAEPIQEGVKLPTPLQNEQVGGGSNNDPPLDAIINPDLDGELLQTLIDSARKLIVNLYISCETDFLEGLHIFEAIVATQLGKTTNSQIKYLDELTLEYLGNL